MNAPPKRISRTIARNAKKGLASEEACQEDSKNKIQDGSTRQSLNGFLPCRNANIAISED